MSDECLVTVRAIVKAGDYFYSDGTWSTDLDASKTVVGIVFWSGDPTADDPALKKDHPECINGLAVALTEEVSAFQTNGYSFYSTSEYKYIQNWAEKNKPGYVSLISGLARGDNGNFILGYNNTEVLMAFNNDPDNSSWPLESIGLLEDFRESNPLPETTSGWYMPSVKELSIMCDGPSDYNIFWGARTFIAWRGGKEILVEHGKTRGDQIIFLGFQHRAGAIRPDSQQLHNKPFCFCLLKAGPAQADSHNHLKYRT